ncbi:MAG: hypothetical protein BJ554DRAFT_252 [Olpidium bornovanus]|uniref:Uncharacterized protein n=1 Tax=Olpidium bornovanus TaxID=278681 RepID=A0A8H8DI05_9FUNG|nr:MAG: hypothetical protein BJ554DRAFT_252 [Olpidium bornovanus]
MGRLVHHGTRRLAHDQRPVGSPGRRANQTGKWGALAILICALLSGNRDASLRLTITDVILVRERSSNTSLPGLFASPSFRP